MYDLLKNGHTLVLICLAVLLVTLLIVRQRFPWLQRLARKQFQRWSSPLVIASGLLVVICGSLGFARKEGDSADSLSTALYETFQIFAFNVPHTDLNTPELWCAKIFAMVLAVTVASQGISLLFHDSSVRLQLLGTRDHVVMCGLGRIGRQLIEDLLKKGDQRRIVALEPNEDNHNLKWAREQGVITIIADATKRENLEDIGVNRAAEVFLVTGSDECNIEAAVEIRKILMERGRVSYWMKQPLPPLNCFVHVMDRDLALILREHTDSLEQLSGQTGDAGQAPRPEVWDVEVFNALERTARRLLENIATSHSSAGSMRPAAESEVAHVVMLGFGEFGQTLALQLAELAHFENCKRLRLTVCDHDMAKTARVFTARYVRFGPKQATTADWTFAAEADRWESRDNRDRPSDQMSASADETTAVGIDYVCNARYVEYSEATDDAFLAQLSTAFENTNVKPTILVCFEKDRNNFALAERLRAKLETLGKAWPIFVWIPRQSELSQLLDEKRRQHLASQPNPSQNPKASRPAAQGCDVIPFGQCYGSVSYDEVTAGWTDWLARHIELVWQSPEVSLSVQRLQAALADPDRTARFLELDWNGLDELARNLWARKPEWARASNRSAAIHAVLKVAALGRRIEGVAQAGARQPVKLSVSAALDETLRKMEHYRWVSERLISGWSWSNSPTKDDIRKTRWQITSWDGLKQPPAPLNQSNSNEQAKDERIVQLLLGLIESGILRTVPIESKS